ncbi:MAG: o-succinylbenzoate--CoA ligase [Deltaproteobacteria bacterium]|nr:o-succinylbenzoate--CoA ligase [Deltaproteobacteria bacterium]MBU54149.1 o-succinylbenzoate--CoA ligase [Deltaproteobacteria bacterium]
MNINIATWLTRNATIFANKTAIIDDRLKFTYKELDERVRRLATAFEAKGVKKGDRIAVLLPNNIEVVEALFAAARLGAIFVPLNWRLGIDELEYILNDCQPSLLIYKDDWQDRVDALNERLSSPPASIATAEATENPYEETIASNEPHTNDDYPACDGDDLMIIYTSGTTGNPKGAVLTYTNVFFQTINGWSLGTSPDGIALVLLPLFHVGGLNGSVAPLLHIGATVILQAKFKPAHVLKTIEDEQVTGVLGVPTIFRMLSEQPEFETTDLSKCDVLLSGGAPLPESLIELYHERGLEFRQGYGLTEASPGVTGMGPGECRQKIGSAGRQILYTEVRIVNDAGKQMPTSESGEIIVRGPNVMRGYWNKPEATAKAIKNGWLHTGDVGYFDEDGFLFIVDRMKDMIISGGENIYPAEIEKLLAAHPKVQQATVVGRPDEKWGEIPVAVVVPSDKDLTKDELKAFLTDLARYKQPKAYHFFETLPLNASGKVVKAEVKKQLDALDK